MKFATHRPLRRYGNLHERARQTLGAVGLADREAARVLSLSHGEQRQLEIGLALAGAPRVLLLDEPTAGLSPAESQEMGRLLTAPSTPPSPCSSSSTTWTSRSRSPAT